MRISDWSSDVCSSDLHHPSAPDAGDCFHWTRLRLPSRRPLKSALRAVSWNRPKFATVTSTLISWRICWLLALVRTTPRICSRRSEEHTSELQSLMRISYAVFCLKKKKQKQKQTKQKNTQQ